MYLSEVDAGRRSLTKPITLNESLRSGSDGIADDALPGRNLVCRHLIELMLTVATTRDRHADRRPWRNWAVQRWLEANRVRGIRIDRNIARLVLDNLGCQCCGQDCGPDVVGAIRSPKPSDR